MAEIQYKKDVLVDAVERRLKKLPIFESIVSQLDSHDLWELAYVLVNGTIDEHMGKAPSLTDLNRKYGTNKTIPEDDGAQIVKRGNKVVVVDANGKVIGEQG